MTGITVIGALLSHYRITEKLGPDGRRKVYRTEDTNLNRHITGNLIVPKSYRKPAHTFRGDTSCISDDDITLLSV